MEIKEKPKANAEICVVIWKEKKFLPIQSTWPQLLTVSTYGRQGIKRRKRGWNSGGKQ